LAIVVSYRERSMRSFSRTTVALLIALALSSSNAAQADDTASSEALALFEQRIMPIFRSPQPSSCVQCHLASVDLKNYILPSPEKTFVSLRDQGLINLGSPEESKILTLIQMGDKDLDRGAKLIHAKMRQAEYEAFLAWIKACSSDARLRELPPLSAAEQARPEKSEVVIRHNRKDRLLDSFVRNVWSQRMRCFPCHTPFELDAVSQQHPKARDTHRQFEEQFGQRMNFFKETPEATLRQLITSSRKPAKGHLPVINIDQPMNSLLLLKPLAKVPNKDASGQFEKPSYAEPVTHGGGRKMFPDDQTYKSFLAWLEDYARVVRDGYSSADDLPLDNWYPTNQVIRLSDAPENWPTLAGVQLFVHAWNPDKATWESQPIAFTQGPVTPRHMVNGTLFLLTEKEKTTGSAKATALAPGKYLIKVFVDLQHRLANEPLALFGATEYYGQAEIEAQWREGFQEAELLSAARLKK
jgi:hypothetical protein